MLSATNLYDRTHKYSQDEHSSWEFLLVPLIFFFAKMKSMFCKFIWNNRQARLRLSLLYLPCERWGRSLPNLKWYYWTARLSAASCWFSVTTLQSWVNLERVRTSPLPLKSYLYSANLKELKKHTHNPFVRNTSQVWYEVHLYKTETPTLSQFSHIWGNSTFTPGKNDTGFKLWADKGICKVADLFDKGTFMCFEDLRQKCDIQPKHFFKISAD